MGHRGPQLVSRSRLNGAERPGAGPPPLARPCEPRTTPPPPPAHRKVPHQRRLCAVRPREAVPQPPPPGGHPHGVLPPLDGHERGPELGAISPAARFPGTGGISARAPRGPQLAVWRCRCALAVPSPPLRGWRAALFGRPVAGTPLGPGFPPRPPRHGPRRAGLGQRPHAPGAPGQGVARPGGGLWGPLGGVQQRGHHQEPLRTPRSACSRRRGARLNRWVHAVCYAVIPAPSRLSRPRSNSTPARGTTPPRGRGSRPAHLWGRGGSAAGCTSPFAP